MIFCQYNMDKTDCETASKVHNFICSTVGEEEMVITIPDAFTIAEWDKEEGKEQLIKLRDMINKLIGENDD